MKRIIVLSALAIAVLSSNLCVQNWQCASLYCDQGFCADDFMSTPLQLGSKLYEQCDSNPDCNSGCCMLGWCVPNYSCQAGEFTAPQIEKQEIQKIVEDAKDELKFRQVELWGTCDYNFQCRSNCCKGKTCTFFESACGDQNAMGDQCVFNEDCHSSCCHAGRCSPIWECTNAKRLPDFTDCKYNGQCKSGCCAFGTCRKDMFWCSSEKGMNEDCFFNYDCLSSCCESGKCSHVAYCYSALDFLREDEPRLSVFYDFLFSQEEETLTEQEELELMEATTPIDNSISVELTIAIFLGSFAALLVLIVLAVKCNQREKWGLFMNRGHESHYTSLIE